MYQVYVTYINNTDWTMKVSEPEKETLTVLPDSQQSVEYTDVWFEKNMWMFGPGEFDYFQGELNVGEIEGVYVDRGSMQPAWGQIFELLINVNGDERIQNTDDGIQMVDYEQFSGGTITWTIRRTT